jgi:hypothetical protein
MPTIPAELVSHYEAEGWWPRDTLGEMLARALAPAPRTEFRAHSQVRPYSGTFGEVEHVARRLAAGLRDRGVGPGDVIAFHLPNWMEATARAATSSRRRPGVRRRCRAGWSREGFAASRRARRNSPNLFADTSPW